MLSFSIIQNDQATRARVGSLRMTRAEIATPAFMPVGSLGNVRGVDADELRKLGYGLMLNNAYHLYFRPGHKLVADLGVCMHYTGGPAPFLRTAADSRSSAWRSLYGHGCRCDVSITH